jgi:hypothetical protein
MLPPELLKELRLRRRLRPQPLLRFGRVQLAPVLPVYPAHPSSPRHPWLLWHLWVRYSQSHLSDQYFLCCQSVHLAQWGLKRPCLTLSRRVLCSQSDPSPL